METRAEKKIEKQLDKAEREHQKAAVAEAKGHLHSADKHENRAVSHELRADNLAHQHVGPYTGLNHPYTGATAHPAYGYQRLPRDKKAERFEAKAAEWEKRGNTAKAQKNRDKALRHRQRLQPGYVPIAHPQPYYVDKANRLDQRALRYQQLGMLQQSQRYQQRAIRTRTKHGVTGGVLGGVISGQQYRGTNYPYTGATQHPTHGYTRLNAGQKAQRYDAKAADWERRGDMVKAQKNREKANRYRQRTAAGYVKPTRTQDYYTNRAGLFDQKATRYQQAGRSQQALRAQQRAQRIRTKHNIAAGTGLGAAGLGAGLGAGLLGNNQGHYTAGGTYVGPLVHQGTVYQGLNFPYAGASAHPTYGYQRLTPDRKADRFERKAAEYERRGNLAKAQKNREKALRHRARTQPGYVRPTRQPDYYTNRANVFDQRAAQYTQWGMLPQAQRYQGRSQRIRAKHNIPATAAVGAPVVASSYPRSTYQGLNIPYTGAAAHPTYGYQRLSADKKADRFDLKAAEYERRGNLKKAQKNRQKAQRHRARTQPGYVAVQRPQTYYIDRANQFDQRAYQYQQWGMAPQAQRYQGRSRRIRAKHNIPATAVGSYPVGTYQGLNFPYTGASAHPTYGYQRLAPNKKAERFELKAAEWERRGNLRKAQKNRDKALRYRARTQPGYVAPVRPQTYYVDRANLFDQRALQYQQWGMTPQATRYQQRAYRVRAKHNLPATTLPVQTPAARVF